MDNKDVFRVHVAVFFDDESNVQILKLASAVKDTFASIFPNEPQVLPLPTEAPKDAVRCVFQKEGVDVGLNFSLTRMDYDAGIIDGTQWKNHVEVVAYSFANICKMCQIGIKRIGIVVHARNGKEFIDELNKKIGIEEFVESDEKNISWVTHEKIDANLSINVFITLRFNENDPQGNNINIIDVNTNEVSVLKEKNLTYVIGIITSKIEERINNVF